ncbi:hypothetical protein BU25DRAFT_436176 [Macroventuria anomochaeta]|uniref:Uncharacterized protein n=1 Tax=Macroventuria anomochaeta TaxID=301207 RepID=A0ACB6SIH9_9PLEO|nr:uncharacterized protein BU25DRAFT_436176 [Macroventuria anomochaeta]KAF2633813.1 hypothetical protein BU25DRAFT_436176 [Macroventuria anomochaeta]
MGQNGVIWSVFTQSLISRPQRKSASTTRPWIRTAFRPWHKDDVRDQFQCNRIDTPRPEQQSALLLHAIRQPYEVTIDHAVPEIQQDSELLVKVTAVGLNPMDWTAPDYNFGIPVIPYVSGRELSGVVVKAPKAQNSRVREGDVRRVIFNTIRLPHNVSAESGSILGVAFVSAVLALGIGMGVSFESIENGPDLLKIVRSIESERLPADIRRECIEGISEDDRAQAGDYLVIWGGSSTSAHLTKHIARLAGLKIVSVVDSAKHGVLLSTNATTRPDLLSAAHVLRSLVSSTSPISSLSKDAQNYERKDSKLLTPPSTPLELSEDGPRSHLVGLTRLPKPGIPEDVTLHNVPIKLFHEIPEVGKALSAWCERLLVKGLLVPPDVVGTVKGFGAINEDLDRMRRREISGGRLVAVLP